MQKFSKAWKLTVLLALTMMLVLSGCATKKNNDSGSGSSSPDQSSAKATESPAASQAAADPGADISKEVNLVWYYIGPETPKDINLIQEAVNKITKEKINATMKLMPIPYGDYDTKLNTVVASGEQADIIWTSSWSFFYTNNVAKGAFAPMDDLLDKYGKDIFTDMPAYMRSGVKVGGVTYAIPNYQTMTQLPGFIVQKEYLEKYNFDPSTVKGPKDLEPFLAQVKTGSPGVVPIGSDKGALVGMFTTYHDMIDATGEGYAVIKKSDPYKVLKSAFTPEYEDYLDMVRGWYTKGYINQDAPTLDSMSELQKTGKIVSFYHDALKPGGESQIKDNNGGHDVQFIITHKPLVQTFNVFGTLNAIGANSANKERAMMFLNLVNTDKELYDLIAYGIKDKHYTLNEKNQITRIPDSGYNAADWVIGNTFNGYPGAASPIDNVFEETKRLNESAETSPLLGFVFDSTPVQTQITNVTNVNTKYHPGLNTGAVDKSAKLEEFRNELNKAGIDDIIAELQKQLDAWVKANK